MQKWEHINYYACGKIPYGFSVRSEDDIAGEGRLVGEPKFHSWDKYTTTLTNVYSWGVMIALIIYIPMYLQVLDIPFA